MNKHICKRNRILNTCIVLSIYLFTIYSNIIVSKADDVAANWWHYSDDLYMTTTGSINQSVTVSDVANGGAQSTMGTALKSEYSNGVQANGNMMVIKYPSGISRVYGPYIWLPEGEYRITADINPNAFSSFQSMDIACARAAFSTGAISWDRDSYTNDMGDVQISNFNRNYHDNIFEYTYNIATNGKRGDFEFRFDYNTTGLDMDSRSYLSSLKIEALYTNTVKYDTNGGTLKGNTTGKLTTTTWGTNRTADVDIPTRPGYIFKGWTTYNKATNNSINKTQLAFTGNNTDAMLWDSNGHICNNATTESCYTDYTVYAQWTEKPAYTVTYDANGGTGIMLGLGQDTCAIDTMSSDYNVGSKTTDCYYLGWTLDSGDYVQWFQNKSSNKWWLDFYDASANKWYYCMNTWVRIGTKWYYFDSNGYMQTIYEDNEYSVQNNSFTMTGCTFTGWNTQSNGKGSWAMPGDTETCTQDTTWYAIWYHADQFVNYLGNGLTGVTVTGNDYDISYDASRSDNKFADNSFTKTGYKFVNWNTDPNGNGATYDAGSSIPRVSGRTTIRNAIDDNAVIDLSGDGTANGTSINGCAFNGSTAQYWSMIYIETTDGTPYWAIFNTRNGKVLDVTNGSAENGTQVQLYQYNKSPAQLWTVQMAGNGYYYIKSKLGNYNLEVPGNNVTGRLQIYEANKSQGQKWRLADITINAYAQWQDVTSPTISGIEDQKVYGWTNQNVTIDTMVGDCQSGLESFTLYNDTKQELVKANVVDKRYQYKPVMHDGIDYGHVFNANYYADNNQDVVNAVGNSPEALLNHFLKYGINENRKTSPYFDINIYKSKYADLQNCFGNNLSSYYTHYCNYGYREGRICSNNNLLSCTFSDEQEDTYELIASDFAGNTSKVTFKVKIDKTPPAISGVDKTYDSYITGSAASLGWVNQSLNCKAEAAEQGKYQSGMKSLNLYDSSDTAHEHALQSEMSSLTNVFSDEQDKSYCLIATDNVGNSSELDFSVRIDKTSPAISGDSAKNFTDADGKTSYYAQNDLIDLSSQDVVSKGVASGTSLFILRDKNNTALVTLKSTTYGGSIAPGSDGFKISYQTSSDDDKEAYYVIEVQDLAGNSYTKRVYTKTILEKEYRRTITSDN